MKDVATGRKKLLKISECKVLGYTPPKLPEFSVNMLLSHYAGDSELMDYLPGDPPRNVDKSYFFSIFMSKKPREFQALLEHSSKTTANQAQNVTTIPITAEMRDYFSKMDTSSFKVDKKIGYKVVIDDKWESVRQAAETRRQNLGKRKKDISNLLGPSAMAKKMERRAASADPDAEKRLKEELNKKIDSAALRPEILPRMEALRER